MVNEEPVIAVVVELVAVADLEMLLTVVTTAVMRVARLVTAGLERLQVVDQTAGVAVVLAVVAEKMNENGVVM